MLICFDQFYLHVEILQQTHILKLLLNLTGLCSTSSIFINISTALLTPVDEPCRACGLLNDDFWGPVVAYVHNDAAQQAQSCFGAHSVTAIILKHVPTISNSNYIQNHFCFVCCLMEPFWWAMGSELLSAYLNVKFSEVEYPLNN